MTITTEELGRLRIPLMSIPALGLSAWCPLADAEGTVVGESGPEGEGEVDLYDWNRGGSAMIDRADMMIDLADSATRDRVARWLASRLNLQVGNTAPPWTHPPFGWALRGANGAGEIFHHDRIPALSEVNPVDNRRLSDGTLYMDALALALVAQHIGGAA